LGWGEVGDDGFEGGVEPLVGAVARGVHGGG
jgi:hypothetical protein